MGGGTGSSVNGISQEVLWPLCTVPFSPDSIRKGLIPSLKETKLFLPALEHWTAQVRNRVPRLEKGLWGSENKKPIFPVLRRHP